MVTISRSKNNSTYGLKWRIVGALWYFSDYTINPKELKRKDVKDVVDKAAVSPEQKYGGRGESNESFNEIIKRLKVHSLINIEGRGVKGNRRKLKLTGRGLNRCIFMCRPILELGLNDIHLSKYQKQSIISKCEKSEYMVMGNSPGSYKYDIMKRIMRKIKDGRSRKRVH